MSCQSMSKFKEGQLLNHRVCSSFHIALLTFFTFRIGLLILKLELLIFIA